VLDALGVNRAHVVGFSMGDAIAQLLALDYADRVASPAVGVQNHWLLDDGPSWRERLGQIRLPTLVLHGTEEPLFPIGHAVALASEIPGARLIRLERMGHELPREVWDAVVPEILRHAANG
jgi:pimeloyl-ACP methyl ester carboxylesterase